MLWVVCGIMGGCMFFPMLYVICNCDEVRAWCSAKYNTEARIEAREEAYAKKRAKSGDQAFGSIV